MRISYDSTELIADVKEDIILFGGSFRVYAIYGYREEYDFEYISGYVDADPPTMEEFAIGPIDEDDIADFKKALDGYRKGIESLKETKHELMTLAELLLKLEEQDRII